VKHTFAKVSKVEYQLPSYLSREAQDLIYRLLQKDPSKRPPADRLLRHPFFSKSGITLSSVCAANHVSSISHATTLKSNTFLRKQTEMSAAIASDLPVISTARLKPLRQQTKHGLVEICSDGSIILSFENETTRLRISPSQTVGYFLSAETNNSSLTCWT
jgi:serine/threonine protein kinase